MKPQGLLLKPKSKNVNISRKVYCPFDNLGCKFRHDEEYVEVHDDVQDKNLHVEDNFD